MGKARQCLRLVVSYDNNKGDNIDLMLLGEQHRFSSSTPADW